MSRVLGSEPSSYFHQQNSSKNNISLIYENVRIARIVCCNTGVSCSLDLSLHLKETDPGKDNYSVLSASKAKSGKKYEM